MDLIEFKQDNVIGSKCDRCRDGTYGLEPDNPDGCMECFCFHRTSKCSQGYFKWQRVSFIVFGLLESIIILNFKYNFLE